MMWVLRGTVVIWPSTLAGSRATSWVRWVSPNCSATFSSMRNKQSFLQALQTDINGASTFASKFWCHLQIWHCYLCCGGIQLAWHDEALSLICSRNHTHRSGQSTLGHLCEILPSISNVQRNYILDTKLHQQYVIISFSRVQIHLAAC